MVLKLLAWPGLAAATLLLTASAESGLSPVPRATIMIEAKRVALFAGQPKRRRIGRLVYLGGWELQSAASSFGGISGMMVMQDRIVAVGDAGTVIDFPVPTANRVAGIIREIPAGCGTHWRKQDQDAEALTHDPASGAVWIALEWRNKVCRLSPGLARSEAVAGPPAMQSFPRTGGAEAMTRLADGRFLVFAEKGRGRSDTTPLLVFAADPVAVPDAVAVLRYRPPSGYRPVEAAQLPDGRILVLNRRFTLPDDFRTTLVVIDAAALQRGKPVEGQVIARLAPPAIADNFEALAITQDARGPVIWIASDDNFSFLQRTLLLKFRLAE